MKKKLTVLFFMVAFGVQAQKKSVFKINILSPIVKTFNVQYEQKVKDNTSFQIGFFYTGASISSTDFSGFGITPEYRFYLSSTNAPEGVYVAPFIRYQSFTLTDDSFAPSEASLSNFGGGLILGKQWIFKEKVVLDTFIGPTYAAGSVNVKSGSGTFDTGSLNGFGLRIGVCLGLNF
jgi:hypothetical protein